MLHRFLRSPATKCVVRWGIGYALEQNLAPRGTLLSRAHRLVIPEFVPRIGLPGGRLQPHQAQALLMVNDRP